MGGFKKPKITKYKDGPLNNKNFEWSYESRDPYFPWFYNPNVYFLGQRIPADFKVDSTSHSGIHVSSPEQQGWKSQRKW